MLTETPPQQLVTSLYKHVYNMFSKHKKLFGENGDAACLPTPADKACVEYSTKEGGCITGLYELYKFAQDSGLNKCDPSEENFPPLRNRSNSTSSTSTDESEHFLQDLYFAYLKHPGLDQTCTSVGHYDMTSLEAYRTARFFTNLLVTRGQQVVPMNPPIPETLRKPWLSPIAIEELGGKVRVATAHPAALAHFSRAMSQRLLPVLKRERAFRRILHGDTVSIRGHKTAKVYSADLTAASDYIEHDLAKTVLTAIADGLNIQGVTRDALLKCCGSMMIPKEYTRTKSQDLRTRLGAHMGLGTTWTVLSLLNHYAASQAARDSSFAICGDDLVGIWTRHQINVYEYHLERMGLIPNKDKAYEGSGGVFCEQIVLKGRDGSYHSIHHPVLSEITFARGTPDGAARSDISQLLKGSLLKTARVSIEQNLDRTRANMIEGPVNMGGYGWKARRDTSLKLLLAYLSKGPVRLGHSDDRTKAATQMALLNKTRTPRKGRNIAFGEAIVTMKCNSRAMDISQGKAVRPHTSSSNKKVKRLALSRLHLGESILRELSVNGTSAPHTTRNAPRLPRAGSVFVPKKEHKDWLIKKIKESLWISSSGKSKVIRTIHFMNEKNFSKSIARAAKLASDHPHDGLITTESLEAILQVTVGKPTRHLQNGTELTYWWERPVTLR
ncbi:RNA-dependent RNA polymerase [Erysiphe necator associated narnavirus 42]|nr:RNA-dependent RNA polymerase [Erysiphe necator associated narnavirus 42]